MHAPSLTVAGVTFAATTPAVIVPLLAPDAAGLAAEASRAVAAGADCLEWRVDHLATFPTPDAVGAVVASLRGVARGRPVLATWRTVAEGGRGLDDEEVYPEVVRALAAAGVALVDVEVQRTHAREAIAAAHAGGARVVGSRHMFDRTPDEDVIVAALAQAETLGADIAKVAVMPADAVDTLTLLRALARRFAVARTPLLAIAMGPVGAVSRVVGPVFGSCGTFATVPDTTGTVTLSAPGQLSVTTVQGVWDALAQLG